MTFPYPYLTKFIFVLLLAALIGCAKSAPTRTYVLSYGDSADAQESGSTFRDGPVVGVGPIDLPPYLNRLGIVTRNGSNVLQIAEFDQWGDELDVNFRRVLTERLSERLSTDRIFQYPWKFAATMEYQVIVDVTAFETDRAGTNYLQARWSVLDGVDRKVLLMARSQFQEPIGSSGVVSGDEASYAAVAAAMGRNIDSLSKEIAEGIQSLPSQ